MFMRFRIGEANCLKFGEEKAPYLFQKYNF